MIFNIYIMQLIVGFIDYQKENIYSWQKNRKI
jgi:hypothetical protein